MPMRLAFTVYARTARKTEAQTEVRFHSFKLTTRQRTVIVSKLPKLTQEWPFHPQSTSTM